MADAYDHLRETYATSLDALKLTDTISDSNVMDQILSNTVSLFRPYFTWRQLALKSDTRQTKVDITSVDKEEPISLLCEHESGLPVSSGVLDGDSGVELLVCHKDCPFYSHSKNSLPESHSYSTVLSEAGPQQVTSLCLLHSPFVMLASRQVTVEQFVELLNSTTKANACHLLCSVCELSQISCHLWARYMYCVCVFGYSPTYPPSK